MTKAKRLENRLKQGKVISGFADAPQEDGRVITTMACMCIDAAGLFEVDIEVFFAGIDISELNLKDEVKTFPTLEEAIDFMEAATPVKFIEMRAS